MSSSKSILPSLSIPPHSRKVVQDLKEIVPNSDDEIYAMLKECNMDPNETVQRLINQDPFHEVKRRRDKKKENMYNTQLGDSRARPSIVGPSGRGGRVPTRGAGRGNYVSRHNSGEPSSDQCYNGAHQTTRASSSSTLTMNPQFQAQQMPVSVGTSLTITSTTSGSPEISNGTSPYNRAAQGPCGSMGTGSVHSSMATGSVHSTMADIVKSTCALQSPALAVNIAIPASTSQHYISASIDGSSGVYSSSTDSVLSSNHDSCTAGNIGTISRDTCTVGIPRPFNNQPPRLSVEVGTVPSSLAQRPPTLQANIDVLDASTLETEIKPTWVDGSSASVSSSLAKEHPANQFLPADAGSFSEAPPYPSSSSGLHGNSGSRIAPPSNQHIGRTINQGIQHSVGTQKGLGLEWKPKASSQNTGSSQAAVRTSSASEAVRASSPASSPEDTGTLSAATLKLQDLSVQDDQAVIIPNHLQVPEAEQTGLSFGSFGPGFGTTFMANFASEDTGKSSASTEDTMPADEALPEQPTASSVVSATPAALDESYTHQSTSTSVEVVASGCDVSVSMPTSEVSQPEISKPDTPILQSQPFPYLPTIQNYPGFGVMPQIMGSQYSYETSETQPQEVSRLPSFVQPYSDPATNYYTAVFRPGSDGDARYPHFGSRYNGSVTLMTGQSISSSHEGGNLAVLSTAGPSGQISQTLGIAQTTLPMPQPPLPIHAYPAQPAGVPISPFTTNIFGYQYVPPSYTYMHPPYQHNYTGNTGYPQPSAGSSYAPAAVSTYPPAGAPAVKYPLPQYKPAAAVGNAPHAAIAAGYGSYSAAPSGFVVNPTVTAGSASGYDDVGGPQYKESNLYIPSHQHAEGSGIWIQAQLSRDMAGLQSNSYYNMPGQNQHTGYAHAQAATAFASPYHPSQSGPTAVAHQLLQQPQAIGAVGAGGAQVGPYQQPQRGQLNWTNGY